MGMTVNLGRHLPGHEYWQKHRQPWSLAMESLDTDSTIAQPRSTRKTPVQKTLELSFRIFRSSALSSQTLCIK